MKPGEILGIESNADRDLAERCLPETFQDELRALRRRIERHTYRNAKDAIALVCERTGEPFELAPCPHCGHRAHLRDPEKSADMWGGYEWRIVCSSSHCRASVSIVADGYSEQIDGALNPHIPKNQLYRDRLTTLRQMWNRRP